MNRKSFKLAACGLMLTLAMPVMGQGTDEYLQPCDVTFKVVAMGGGNIFDDPEGFDNQMKAIRNNSSTYDIKCWATKVEPSFEESYEIQCIYNRQSQKCRLELKIQNQQDPHVMEIDEELAYLEEPYVPHPLAGVMAQNKPAFANEKHVWTTGDQKIKED